MSLKIGIYYFNSLFLLTIYVDKRHIIPPIMVVKNIGSSNIKYADTKAINGTENIKALDFTGPIILVEYI